MALNGQILDGEGTLGQESCHLSLQGARSCRVEMQEINSLLCKYMRVMPRGRAKTVENGRVTQWSIQRLHEHWRIPPVSVEVVVRRVGWLQAMLRDETNHAQPLASIFGRFLGKEVLEVKGEPSIETCTCLKESRAQRSFTRLFGRMGSSRYSWHSLRRGRFFCGLARLFCAQLVGQWPQG